MTYLADFLSFLGTQSRFSGTGMNTRDPGQLLSTRDPGLVPVPLEALAPNQAMAAVKNPSKKGGTRRRSPVTYLLRCTHIAIKQRLLPLLLFLQQARL